MSEILFTNCKITDGRLRYHVNKCVGVSNGKIDYVGDYCSGSEREYDCRGGILLPAFCNAHAHSAMTLLRGIGEDLTLRRWLDERIFPAEAKLTGEDCHTGTLLACAEMLKYGVASCSDMYFFGEASVKAYEEAGIKVNFAPAITCFDNSSFEELPVFEEYEKLLDIASGSRLVKVDLGVHSVYAVTGKVIEGASRYAADNNLGMHVHVSETAKENADCYAEHGLSPVAYLEKLGAFSVHAQAAHCVWLSENDREILRRNRVTVVSCPESNLKLGSGICDYTALRKSGVIFAVATDGAASNNNLNMLKEARLAALLAKGSTNDASVFLAADALWCAYRGGYIAQGRYDSGYLNVGMSADLTVFPDNGVNMTPNGDIPTSLLYSSDGIADMTMVDGKILYDRGNYATIDIEKVMADAVAVRSKIDGR